MDGLLERLVSAVETIADVLSKPVLIGAETNEPTPVEKAEEAGLYPDDKDRKGWFAAARDRGLELGPKTSTKNVKKAVLDFDQKAEKGEVVEQMTKEPEPEPDPFGEPAAEEKVTREQVLAALQEVQKTKGNDEVVRILKEAGKLEPNPGTGVPMFKDLPEDMYWEVLNATR